MNIKDQAKVISVNYSPCSRPIQMKCRKPIEFVLDPQQARVVAQCLHPGQLVQLLHLWLRPTRRAKRGFN